MRYTYRAVGAVVAVLVLLSGGVAVAQDEPAAQSTECLDTELFPTEQGCAYVLEVCADGGGTWDGYMCNNPDDLAPSTNGEEPGGEAAASDPVSQPAPIQQGAPRYTG